MPYINDLENDYSDSIDDDYSDSINDNFLDTKDDYSIISIDGAICKDCYEYYSLEYIYICFYCKEHFCSYCEQASGMDIYTEIYKCKDCNK